MRVRSGHIQGNLALRVCEPLCGECAVQRQILSPEGYQGEGISVPRIETMRALGFALMLSFFTLSGISTNHTYFERYQDAWDVMATLEDTKIEDFPTLLPAVSGEHPRIGERLPARHHRVHNIIAEGSVKDFSQNGLQTLV